MRSTCLIALCLAALLTAPAPLPAAETIHWFPFDVTPAQGGPGWDTTGDWEYGAPQGLGGDPFSAHTYLLGGEPGYVYGNDLSHDGLYPNEILATSSYTLITPPLNCVGFQNVRLRFWRWLGVERSVFDQASVWVSNDGADWSALYGNPDYNFVDSTWTQVEYDISTVADGQPTVYVAWVLGPTDWAVNYCGWNIDDVEVVGDPATDIVVWTTYADVAPGGSYDNVADALGSYAGACNVSLSDAATGAELETALAGRHVFLVPEQELATATQLQASGSEFAETLWWFVFGGGTVVVLSEKENHQGFLSATGLLGQEFVAQYAIGSGAVVDGLHPLATGLGGSILLPNATSAYAVSPEATVVVDDTAGNAVVAARQLGAGAVVTLGFDYHQSNADAARILANAVQYPRASKKILLYDPGDSVMRVGAEALHRLKYPFTVANEGDFDSYLGAEYWHLTALDDPDRKPSWGWNGLLEYVGGGGHAILATWDLAGEHDSQADALCAAFGVTAGANLDYTPAVYDWDTYLPVFYFREYVPSPVEGWSDVYWWDTANTLGEVAPDSVALAGFTSAATDNQAAIVAGNNYRTIINGFLWDHRYQDADYDGVQDCVELVMNETQMLLAVPYPDFDADPVAGVRPLAVAFTDYTWGNCESWSWEFGDGGSSTLRDPLHTYQEPGFYTITLAVQNNNGRDTWVRDRHIAVGFGDTGPDYWAFCHTIACYEAGIAKGYSLDEYSPEEVVNRAQMAVYMARAVSGGDENIPQGPPTPTFSDVGTGYWAYRWIEQVHALDIVEGYEGKYLPEDAVDRGQMAVFVARGIAGGDSAIPEGPPTPHFPDVDAGYWAYRWVEYIYDQGVTGGYEDNLYHPEYDVTRGMMAVYVQRAFDLWIPSP